MYTFIYTTQQKTLHPDFFILTCPLDESNVCFFKQFLKPNPLLLLPITLLVSYVRKSFSPPRYMFCSPSLISLTVVLVLPISFSVFFLIVKVWVFGDTSWFFVNPFIFGGSRFTKKIHTNWWMIFQSKLPKSTSCSTFFKPWSIFSVLFSSTKKPQSILCSRWRHDWVDVQYLLLVFLSCEKEN